MKYFSAPEGKFLSLYSFQLACHLVRVVRQKSQSETEIRIDEWAKSLPVEKFESVILSVEKPKIVWVS
ncbi:MAG: hypothetical protein F6K34_22875, partial [Okeania sp. SIO4D6]|nr:hypothetical protein [Okeania sp. SIO4D6]